MPSHSWAITHGRLSTTVIHMSNGMTQFYHGGPCALSLNRRPIVFIASLVPIEISVSLFCHSNASEWKEHCMSSGCSKLKESCYPIGRTTGFCCHFFPNRVHDSPYSKWIIDGCEECCTSRLQQVTLSRC